VQTSSTRTYTASVCDLVHGHVHFVLLRAKGATTMLFKQDETALWQVMLLAATAIYAVTMLSVHVCELVHPDEPAVTSQHSKYAKLAAHAACAGTGPQQLACLRGFNSSQACGQRGACRLLPSPT
jgi:hypothetical protein